MLHVHTNVYTVKQTHTHTNNNKHSHKQQQQQINNRASTKIWKTSKKQRNSYLPCSFPKSKRQNIKLPHKHKRILSISIITINTHTHTQGREDIT